MITPEQIARQQMFEIVSQGLIISVSTLNHAAATLRDLLKESGAFSYGQGVMVNGRRGILTISWEPGE